MISFLLRRLFWIAIIMWGVFTFTFFAIRMVPGSPLMGERQLEPEIQARMEAHYGLDKPLPVQYWIALKDVLRFDLGLCLKMVDFRVNEVIAQGFPKSAALGVVALCFALFVGVLAGVVSAVKRQSIFDLSLMTVATVGIAVPEFVVAGLAVIAFVFVVPIFPAAGWGTPWHLVLPGCCLGAPYAAYIARLTRTGMLDVLNQDYIRTAYAKGLRTPSVILRHALKGAMLPVVSFLGPAIAGILTGSLVLENIFQIPGLGTHFVQAVSQRDLTLASGMFMLYTALLCGMNLIVDVSYAYLDPRVKLE